MRRNFSIQIVFQDRINFRRFVVLIIISYSQLCHVSDFLLESSRRKVTGIASDGTITIQATQRSFKHSNVENTAFFTSSMIICTISNLIYLSLIFIES